MKLDLSCVSFPYHYCKTAIFLHTDPMNPPISFTNDDGQTILVTLEDSNITDQVISVTDSTSGEDKLLLVTTVGEVGYVLL